MLTLGLLDDGIMPSFCDGVSSKRHVYLREEDRARNFFERERRQDSGASVSFKDET